MPALAESGRIEIHKRSPEPPKLADSVPPKGPDNRGTTFGGGDDTGGYNSRDFGDRDFSNYFSIEYKLTDPSIGVDSRQNVESVIIKNSPVHTPLDTITPPPRIQTDMDIQDTLP